jgi:hypothetical protein
MQITHRFDIDSDNGDEVVLVCSDDGCRRRIVVKRSGGLVVLDKGDFGALHVGGSLGMHMSTSIDT